MQTACEDRLAEIQERQETLREYGADLERGSAAGHCLSTMLVACCVCFPHAVMHPGEGLHEREPARYVCFSHAVMHQ